MVALVVPVVAGADQLVVAVCATLVLLTLAAHAAVGAGAAVGGAV